MSLDNRILLRQITNDDLLNEIRDVAAELLPDWDFDDENDLGRLLVEIAVALAEGNNVFANRLAQEARSIFSALDPVSVNLHARNLSYRVSTPQPAFVYLKVDFGDSVISVAKTLEKYDFQVSTEANDDNKKFYENVNQFTISNITGDYNETVTLDGIVQTVTPDLIINKEGLYKDTDGNYFAVILMVEGQSQSYFFTIGNGTFQEVEIPNDNVIIDEAPGDLNSFGLDVDFLNAGAVVENYALAENWAYRNDGVEGGPFFVIRYNNSGRWSMQFGDGNAYSVNFGEHRVTYRIGGAAATVGSNEIVNVESFANSTPFENVTRGVTNPAAEFGGKDAQPIATIRKLATTLGSRYYKLDSEAKIRAYAETLSGVLKCKVYAAGSIVEIIPIPFGGGTLEFNLKNVVSQAIQERLSMGYTVRINDPIYVPVAFTITAQTTDEFNNTELQNQIAALLKTSFDPLSNSSNEISNVFIDKLAISDIGFVLKEIEGIFDYQIADPATDVILAPDEVLDMNNSTFNITVTGGV